MAGTAGMDVGQERRVRTIISVRVILIVQVIGHLHISPLHVPIVRPYVRSVPNIARAGRPCVRIVPNIVRANRPCARNVPNIDRADRPCVRSVLRRVLIARLPSPSAPPYSGISSGRPIRIRRGAITADRNEFVA